MTDYTLIYIESIKIKLKKYFLMEKTQPQIKKPTFFEEKIYKNQYNFLRRERAH